MEAASVRTFLIADVRGYTSFTLHHGDAAAARLVSVFARTVREVVATHDGQVAELLGDQALAVFISARQALWAAVEIQERFEQQRAAEPTYPLHVGIGVDAGEAIPFEGGYRGAALNLAARLCARALPGEVLTSGTVIALVRKIEGLDYGDRGVAEFKGFAQPVQVYSVSPDAEDWVKGRAATDAPGDPAESAARGRVRVVMIDDHDVLRDGLKLLLSLEPEIELVGDAAAGVPGVALAERMRADVVVTDIGLPDIDGVEVTRRLRQSRPEARVLVLTAHDEDRYILTIMRAGASGYLLKNTAGADLVRAIRAVADGKPWLSPEIASRLMRIAAGIEVDSEPPPPSSSLAPRDVEVLRLLAGAATDYEIARAVATNADAVDAQLAGIYRKLGVPGRTEAMLWAIREGVIQPSGSQPALAPSSPVRSATPRTGHSSCSQVPRSPGKLDEE